MNSKVWIFLPAYNEELDLDAVLRGLAETLEPLGRPWGILVVDDGSTDATPEMLERARKVYPLEVLRHCINRGLGETERDGFERLAELAEPHDVIVRLDCDDTHEPHYIPAMLDKLDSGFDVVNTSRFQPGGGQAGVNAYRGFISRSANLFMRMLFRIRGVKDCTCGYRAYRARAVQDALAIFGNSFIQLKGLGFTGTVETIVKLKLLGCRFAEVPFVLRYDKKQGQSKMVTSVTTLGYMVLALLHHWPWGGWRVQYKGLADSYRRSPDQALERFARGAMRRSMACRIGG